MALPVQPHQWLPLCKWLVLTCLAAALCGCFGGTIAQQIARSLLLPVSYTHLDVYKRQMLNKRKNIRQNLAGMILIG